MIESKEYLKEKGYTVDKYEFDTCMNNQKEMARKSRKKEASMNIQNEALLNSWAECKKNGKQIAVYEKHGLPVGKIADCQEMSGKILVVLEIPKSGNERVLAVYEQGVYTGLSIGGWTIDGYYDDNDIYHVTEFEWYEVSLTDIPANENALLLEQINENRIKEKAKTTKLEDKKISDEELKIALENIAKSIRGIN